MKIINSLLSAAVLLAVTSAVHATPIVLDFEGIAPHPSANTTLVEDFYNGGTSSNGSSGTDFGIEFSDNALAVCLNTLSVSCSNTSRGGEGDPNSQLFGLFFLSGNETFMNVDAGFDTGFSFFYSAINQAGSVSVFDGLNGTGSLLTTVDLTTTTTGSGCGSYNAGFCTFDAFGVGFAGTARSVSFAGVANQIVFDDITFGSVNPGQPVDVPEPAGLALLGLGLIGLARRKA
ncbi:PEP-CTERM sorting domain-containing protein, partial [Aliiglaciecola sp.]|nr:PEP-CTERM sorting domain-containing protein [Aliiglaciecola sp.]